MPNEFKDGFCIGAVIVFILWFLFVCTIVLPVVETHKDIIRHGCAQYDSVTGDFKWKDEISDKKD